MSHIISVIDRIWRRQADVLMFQAQKGYSAVPSNEDVCSWYFWYSDYKFQSKPDQPLSALSDSTLCISKDTSSFRTRLKRDKRYEGLTVGHKQREKKIVACFACQLQLLTEHEQPALPVSGQSKPKYWKTSSQLEQLGLRWWDPDDAQLSFRLFNGLVSRLLGASCLRNSLLAWWDC